MPAEAVCPHCQLKLRVPADYGGRTVKCPQCQQRFVVMLPGDISRPAASDIPPSPTVATKPAAAFEQLVMSVLDEDDTATDDETDAHVQRVAGPSHFWRCAKCQAVWEKKTLPVATLQNTRIKAMVRCETCGQAVPYADVHAGKYDAPEITLICPHCHLQFGGPADDLLGQPCPGCSHPLPQR